MYKDAIGFLIKCGLKGWSSSGPGLRPLGEAVAGSLTARTPHHHQVLAWGQRKGLGGELPLVLKGRRGSLACSSGLLVPIEALSGSTERPS